MSPSPHPAAPPGSAPPALPRPGARPRSRPARLRALAAETRHLAAEYQTWRDALPENLQEGQMADQLDEVVLELEEVADQLEAIQPPRVGR